MPAVSDPARLTLPIQAYMPADAHLVLLAQAEAVLEKQCMAAAGYDYAPPPVESADGAVSGMTDLRYGIHDLAAARAHGYQPAGDPKDAAAGRALVVAHQKDAGMSDAGRLALFGSRSQGPADPGPSSDAPTHPLSKDGCLAQSTDRVTGAGRAADCGTLAKQRAPATRLTARCGSPLGVSHAEVSCGCSSRGWRARGPP